MFDNMQEKIMKSALKNSVLILCVICLTLILLIVFLMSDLYETTQYRQNEIIVAGAIRCIDDRGWFALDDKTHASINIGDIETTERSIRIYFKFKASKTHTFIIVPDETLSKYGFLVGSKVSPQWADLFISKIENGEIVPVNAASLQSDLGNFWIYGLFEK